MSGGILSRKVTIQTTTPIDVLISPANTNVYNESLSVAGLGTVTILTYTVAANRQFKLQGIAFSGGNKAVYSVELNGSIIAKQITYYTKFNGDFIFYNYELVAGDIIKLIVENKTNTVADFNANLIGRLDSA